MEQGQIEHIILSFLAEDAGRDPDGLRADLERAGEELPVDSLLAVEVLARVQRVTGVTLRPSPDTARALRSVRGFALAVAHQITERQRGTATA